jgi:hypothetical protein
LTVFIDTAVVMYAGGGDHPLRRPCQRLLERIADGELEAVTSVEVIQEILHRFTALRRPELGAAMARDTLDIFAPVLPVTHAVMRRLPELVEAYPALAARDLVHVATCLQEGISDIVSPDRGFDSVPGIRRIDPADAATI